MFIIMNQMLSVRVEKFLFHLFIKVYRYPVSTRKFHGISVNHEQFGILVISMEVNSSQAYTPEKLPLVNGSFVST